MTRTCTVCLHSEREAIDKALVAGEPVRSVASRYVPLKPSSMQRHKEDHLPQTLSKAREARAVARADDLLLHVKALQGKSISLLKAAEEEGDFRTALAGVREARACVELLAKLTGELESQPTINLTISPQWVELRAVIVQALEPFPDARHAVAKVLCEVSP
jgi:tRNA(Phe) wybutosine-synthesizing methylase Tyw3